ncbi:MAG: hypothetical protein MK095_09035, partial [Phycisphaerales bacterium]|nr:hypothetical protein [Phycisphaerales bacterium]
MKTMYTFLLALLLATTGTATGIQPESPPTSSEAAAETGEDQSELKALQTRFRNARTQTDLPAMRQLRTDV